MAIEASLVCYVAFLIPLIVAPYSIVQRRWINKLPTIRGQINLCREQISRLAQQNLRFSKENDRLEAEHNRLRQVEQNLAETVGQSGETIDELCKLIKENGAIQKEMKVRLDVQIKMPMSPLTPMGLS